MPDPNGNIFLTTENLAFALPLIVVCGTYAYFKFIPLEYGLPALGVVFLAFQVRAQVIKRKNDKLQNIHLDERAMRDIIGEEEEKDKQKAADAARDMQKARNRVQNRLAQEKKQRKGKGGSKNDDEDDDVDALASIVNGKGKKQK